VDVCIKQYLDFSESVFRLDKNILSIPGGENNAYFSEQPLEAALKKVVLEATKCENTLLADDGDLSCPVFVVTTYGRIADGPLKLFKSYGFDKDQTSIWQAARATSAAPGFFPPAKVDVPPGPPGWYVDGGVRANNPSWEALVEAKKHWKTRKCFIVSIGTGFQKPVDFIGKKTQGTIATPDSEYPESGPSQNAELNDELHGADSELPSKSLLGGLKQGFRKTSSLIGGTIKSASTDVTDKAGGIKVPAHVINALVNLTTSSESTHVRVWEEANSEDEAAQFPYFRFNVLRGMDEIGLEEWRMAETLADLTRSYLDSPDVKRELGKCATGLLNPSAFEGTYSHRVEFNQLRFAAFTFHGTIRKKSFLRRAGSLHRRASRHLSEQ
jgi:predicted acylesterase/phospholipase RssA